MNSRVLLGALVLFAACATAQTMDPATRALIERLQDRIDGLEKRIAELEKDKAPGAAAAHDHDQVPMPAATAESAQPTYPALKIAGFADLDFAATNNHAPAAGFGAQTV